MSKYNEFALGDKIIKTGKSQGDENIVIINNSSEFPTTIKDTVVYRITSDITVSGTTYSKGLYEGKNGALIRLIGKDELDGKTDEKGNLGTKTRAELVALLSTGKTLTATTYFPTEESPDGSSTTTYAVIVSGNSSYAQIIARRTGNVGETFVCGKGASGWSDWQKLAVEEKQVYRTTDTQADGATIKATVIKDINCVHFHLQFSTPSTYTSGQITYTFASPQFVSVLGKTIGWIKSQLGNGTNDIAHGSAYTGGNTATANTLLFASSETQCQIYLYLLPQEKRSASFRGSFDFTIPL